MYARSHGFKSQSSCADTCTVTAMIIHVSINNNYYWMTQVFVISGIIKVEVSVISRSRRLRLITLTETLIIPDITKTESNNCFLIHCFEENNDKHIITAINLTLLSVNLTLLLEIMHWARNLQIIH